MKKIIWISIFAISMGFLEASVVIYLRQLYYPDGFAFPLKGMPEFLILTELAREAATILMIAAIAWLAGTNHHNRLSWFLFVFAIWDLFYYVFLKLILQWPESFFTWDVLFLIPFVWVSPVLAPVILCILMLILWKVVHHYDGLRFFRIHKWDYAFLILGSAIHIINFCWDNASYMLNHANTENPLLLQLNYVPQSFNWWVFSLACLILGAAIFNIWSGNKGDLERLRNGQLF